MTFINGKLQTKIDVLDRGLAYGDGLFETIACIDGRLHNWDLHWQRLNFGAQALAIELPDEQIILTQIKLELDHLSEPSDRVIKLIITRGQGGRGYTFPESQQCSVIISTHPWPERSVQDYQQGIEATICQTCLARQPSLAGIKHLNRLEQVLGRNEFRHTNFQEGIMFEYSESNSSYEKIIVEGTSSNLFFVHNDKLCTPEIDTCGVRGTIRAAILSLAAQIGIETQQGHYPLKLLKEATEMFFTNSVYGILPVASIIVSETEKWSFSNMKANDRIITSQLAEKINKALKRPV